MDSIPVDMINYAKVLAQTRRRRKYFFSTVIVYLPALFITNRISPTDRAMGALFVAWVVILTVVTFLAALCRCPRCGNYFHLNGTTLLVLRKCLHCQLHINAAAPVETAIENQSVANNRKGHP